MKPMAIEATHTAQDSLPTVAATAPIENSTSGGTPLATQNAPVQSMPRSSPLAALSPSTVVAVVLTCPAFSCASHRIYVAEAAPCHKVKDCVSAPMCE